jgi:hypothetical protein
LLDTPLAEKIIGGTLTSRDAAVAKEAQYMLFEALKAHIASLESERDRAVRKDEAVLDRRLAAATSVLDWLSTRIEPVSSSNSTAAIFAGCG